LEHRGLAGILEISVNIGDDTIGVSFGPEARLILRCLRRDADCGAADSSVSHISSELGVAPEGLDWDRLTLAAGAHGVLPLVYRRLKSASDVPREALARMRAEFSGNSLNNLHLARELARLTGLLKAQGIGAIALKGPVLALKAWGDIALRQFNDLDLLVRPVDAAGAAEVLIAAGYWPRTFDREDPARSIAHGCEDEFMQPGSPWMIDLHWELHPSNFSYGPASTAIWDRAESVRVEGAEVLTLAPNDLVLYLAVHSAKHGWISLGWVSDFERTMRAIDEAELPAMLEAARGSGCLRMLLLAIALAADLLDAPIPPTFADALRSDRAVAPLVAGIERRLFANVGMRARLYSEWVVPLWTITGTRGRLRHFANRALTPNVDDFDFLPLPRVLHPLYYAVRPLRLAWQQGRRLFVDVPQPLKRLRGVPR
jgi:Uncharacterised nucleotidyltransferase